MVRTFGASDPSRRVPTPREIWGDPSGVGYYFFYFFCVRLREREGRSYSTRANPKRVASDRAETHRKRAANTRRTRAARRPGVEGSRWTRAATSTRAVLQR